MDRRKSLANRQDSAQFAIAARMPFAPPRSIGKAEGRATDRSAFARTCQDCYPSSLLWPVRDPDGPSFWRGRGSATFRATRIFPFSTPANPLWRCPRIQPGHWSPALRPTMKRGSLSCINLSPHWPCLWFLPRATARSIPIVRVLAPLGAASLARSPTTIWRKAPLLVASWAPWRQIRVCAAKPFGQLNRLNSDTKAIRGIPRVAFCVARPAEGGAILMWGRPACSRRS